MTTIGIRRNPAVEAPGVEHGRFRFARRRYADVIAMCVPSTPSNATCLTRNASQNSKPDAIVINAGRGDAIDVALADALANGIRGDGLDVTEPALPAASSEPALSPPHVAGGNTLARTAQNRHRIE